MPITARFSTITNASQTFPPAGKNLGAIAILNAGAADITITNSAGESIVLAPTDPMLNIDPEGIDTLTDIIVDATGSIAKVVYSTV